MIHVIGDSHARIYKMAFLYCCHYLGAVTMNRVGRDGIDSFHVNKNHFSEGDTVIFVFGEIDVRCHVLKQKNAGRPLDEIIERLASEYITAIDYFRKKFNNINCIIQLVIPPTNQQFNPKYPFYGSIEDRVGVNNMLNESLKRHCKNSSIKVLDLTDLLSDENGSLNPIMSDEGVHCNKKVFPLIEKALLPNICFKEKQKIILFRLMKWRIIKIAHTIKIIKKQFNKNTIAQRQII